MADTTTFDFTVKNGRGISAIAKVSVSGLVDTYRITYNDNTTSTFTVTNGAKGDKGDNAYVWIRYASQKPTAASHSFGVLPDNWMGVYSGNSATAPTDWTKYQWFEIKGEKGDIGNPALLTSQSVTISSQHIRECYTVRKLARQHPTVAQGRLPVDANCNDVQFRRPDLCLLRLPYGLGWHWSCIQSVRQRT